ncbi:MAG: hypothetical protein KGD60_10780 [Candidatus Thorarchaeota archaeon]|nr:hypothetical protein [Candidatus Thorarchaeota archaeon]
MKKNLLVVLVISTIGISAVSLVGLQANLGVIITGTDLTWSINEGDELSFTVNVTGTESSWYGETTSTEFNWSSDNVTLRILELPDFPNTVGKDTFIADIMRPTKIQCISNNIPSNYSTLLVSLLSKFLLPTGSWDMLDSMFDDDLPTAGGYPDLNDLEFDTDYFAGQIFEGRFYLGLRRYESRFPNWGTESWHGWINLETGIPTTAVYNKAVPDCTASFFLSMNVAINSLSLQSRS